MQPQQEQNGFLQQLLQNKGIIIKICNSFCTAKSDREDLAQDIIYHLWKGAQTFNPGYKFTTWMYRVALNVAISNTRKEKKARDIIVFNEAHLEIEDKVFDWQTFEENANLLQRCITELPELDRALMILYFEEKSYKEIAEIIGITETNVATKIGRLKERLKRRVQSMQNSN